MELISFFRSLKLQFLVGFRWLSRTRGIWVRVLFCWVIGITVTIIDDSSSKYDWRFQLRSNPPAPSNLVILEIEQRDWLTLNGEPRNLIRPLKEVSAFTDSFYWQPKTWQMLLEQVLNQKPLAVAVTFFFPAGSLRNSSEELDTSLFFDPKVFWAARLDNDGRAILPAFTLSYGTNSGLIDFFADDDGTIRRFASPLVQIPHLAVRLAEVVKKSAIDMPRVLESESRTINYTDIASRLPVVRMRDFIEAPANFTHLFKDKVVLIGTRDLDGHNYVTPLGQQSRAELLAITTENFINDSWIVKPPLPVIYLYLLVLVLLATVVILSYPQTIGLFVLVWLGLGSVGLSLWAFDSYSVWLPLLAPAIELFVAYVLFVGHQLSRQENLIWRLAQEKKYLQEVEQLKNNFVSLFSHDLKTPIAKIQGICDRLLAQSPSNEVNSGLLALRQESTELHRYIQSILRVSRIESSDFRINKEPADINEIILKVCQQLKPLTETKEIDLQTDLEPIFSIEVDPSLIQEVILNLAENAIKYSGKGDTVIITAREYSDQIVVAITDTGPGIAEEEQTKIFEKFYRGNDHQLSTKGSGLGLYLVKYFIELHGGRTFIRSKVGEGTRIGFSLPIATQQSFASENMHA